MIKIVLSILVLISAIPLAYILAGLTKDEKEIYQTYFPALMWILAVFVAIFFSLDIVIGLSFLFMLILVFVWGRL